jgi:hypothetical protein
MIATVVPSRRGRLINEACTSAGRGDGLLGPEAILVFLQPAFVLAQQEQTQGAVEVGLGIVGGTLEGFAELSQDIGGMALVQQGDGQAVVPLREIAVTCQQPVEDGVGLVELAKFIVQVGDVQLRPEVAGMQLQNAKIAGVGLLVTARFAVGIAQVQMRLRLGGRQRQRLLQPGDGLVGAIVLQKDAAQLHVSAGLVAVQFQDALEAPAGLVGLTTVEQGQPQVVMVVGVARL